MGCILKALEDWLFLGGEVGRLGDLLAGMPAPTPARSESDFGLGTVTRR